MTRAQPSDLAEISIINQVQISQWLSISPPLPLAEDYHAKTQTEREREMAEREKGTQRPEPTSAAAAEVRHYS